LVLVKVVTIGPPHVGKTALLHRLSGQSCDNNIPTVTISEFRVERFDPFPMTLNLWDTAGQESLFVINKLYYRNSSLALACFTPDVEPELENWISTVKEVSPHVQVILVLTKSDVASEDELLRIRRESDSLLTKYEAIQYIETSARTGDGIDCLLTELSNAVARNEGIETELGNSVDPNRRSARSEKSRCC
jgi:small GTP-binding protein